MRHNRTVLAVDHCLALDYPAQALARCKKSTSSINWSISACNSLR
jgi:hypothetical protein